jgi:hypothetical protein
MTTLQTLRTVLAEIKVNAARFSFDGVWDNETASLRNDELNAKLLQLEALVEAEENAK